MNIALLGKIRSLELSLPISVDDVVSLQEYNQPTDRLRVPLCRGRTSASPAADGTLLSAQRFCSICLKFKMAFWEKSIVMGVFMKSLLRFSISEL